MTQNILPTFIPNDYLFEKHADKGKTKAHIYAWAYSWDIMSKFLKKPMIEMENALKYKIAYDKELGYFKGKKYDWFRYFHRIKI